MAPNTKRNLLIATLTIAVSTAVATPIYLLWQEYDRQRKELDSIKLTIARTQLELDVFTKEQRVAFAELDQRLSPIPEQVNSFKAEMNRDLVDHEKMLSEYFDIQRAGKSIVAAKRKDGGQSIFIKAN